tara:strand:+ start:1790 stop:2458 length:669 start_codon:yes stop_codon:yes gene_type:complete
MLNSTASLITALSGVQTAALEALGDPLVTPYDLDSEMATVKAVDALTHFADFQEKLLYTSALMTAGLGFAGGHLEDTNNPPDNTATAVVIGGAQLIAYIAAPKLLGFEGETTADAWRFLTQSDEDFNEKALRERFTVLKLLFVGNSQVIAALNTAEDELKKFRSRNRTVGFLVGCANAYHGYKRNNDSLLYGALWGFMAGTAGLGLAAKQGYGRNVVGSSEM